MPWNPFARKPNYEDMVRSHRDEDLEIYGCGKDAPSKSSIADYEKQIGFALPEDFRDFSCSPVGGVYIAVKEAIWPRPKAYEVAPFWSFLYGFFVYGFGKEIPEWMDIRLATPKFREETKSNYVPCLKILGQADGYCFDESKKLRQWDHETGEMAQIQKSFTEIFTQELIELKVRKERKKAEAAS